MDDLIAFLNARYDEAASPRAVPDWHESWCLSAEVDNGVCFYCGADEDPAKVEYVPQSEFRLADIASKRQIIALAQYASNLDSELDGAKGACGRDLAADPYVGDLILRQLALPSASHPDYRAGWRP